MAIKCGSCGRRACRGHTTREYSELEEMETFARSNGIRVNTRDHTRKSKDTEVYDRAVGAAGRKLKKWLR